MSVAFISGKVRGGKSFQQLSRVVTVDKTATRHLMSYDMGCYASLPSSFVSYCKKHGKEATTEFEFALEQKDEFYRNMSDFLKTFGLFEEDSEERMRKGGHSYLNMFQRICECDPEEDVPEKEALIQVFEERSAILFVNNKEFLSPVLYGDVSTTSSVFLLADEDEIYELDFSTDGNYFLGLTEDPKIHACKDRYQYVIPRLNDRIEPKTRELLNRPVALIDFIVNRGKWMTVFREDNASKLEYLLGCANADRDDKMWFNFQNFAIKTHITIGMIGKFSNILTEMTKCKEWSEKCNNGSVSSGVDYQRRLEELQNFKADTPTLIYCAFAQGFLILILPNNASPNDPLYADCGRWAYQFLKKICRTVILVPDEKPLPERVTSPETSDTPKVSLLQTISGIQTEKVSEVRANGSGENFNVMTMTMQTYSTKRTFVDFQHFTKWIEHVRSYRDVSTARLVNRSCSDKWWTASENPSNCWFKVKSNTDSECKCLSIESFTSLDNGSISIELNEDRECFDVQFYRLCDETEEGSASFSSQPLHPELVATLRCVESNTRIVNSWTVEDGVLVLACFNDHLTELFFLRRCYNDYFPDSVYRCDISGVPSSASYAPGMRILVFAVSQGDKSVVISVSLDESYCKIFERQRSLCDFYPLIREKSRSHPMFGGLMISADGLVGYSAFFRGGHEFILQFNPSDLAITDSSIIHVNIDGMMSSLVPLYSSQSVSYFAGITDSPDKKNMKVVSIWALKDGNIESIFAREERDITINSVGIYAHRDIPTLFYRPPTTAALGEKPRIYTLQLAADKSGVRCDFSASTMMEFAVSSLSEYGIGTIEREYSPGGRYSPLELQTISLISKNESEKGERVDLESLTTQVSYLESSIDIPVMLEVLPSNYELWLMNDSKTIGAVRNGMFPLISKFFTSPRFAVLDPIVDSVSRKYASDEDDSYFYERRIRESLLHPFIRMTSVCSDSEGNIIPRQNRIISLINMGCDNGSSLLSSLSGIPFMNPPSNTLLIGSTAIPIYPTGTTPDGDRVFKYTEMESFANVECLLYSVDSCDCSEAVFAFGSAVYGSEYIILNFSGDINEVDTFFTRVISENLGWDEIATSLSGTSRIQIFIICELSSSSSLVIDKIKRRLANQSQCDCTNDSDSESGSNSDQSDDFLCDIMRRCDFIFIDRNDNTQELCDSISTNMFQLTGIQSGRFRCPVTRMTIMSAIFGAGIDRFANS